MAYKTTEKHPKGHDVQVTWTRGDQLIDRHDHEDHYNAYGDGSDGSQWTATCAVDPADPHYINELMDPEFDEPTLQDALDEAVKGHKSVIEIFDESQK